MCGTEQWPVNTISKKNLAFLGLSAVEQRFWDEGAFEPEKDGGDDLENRQCGQGVVERRSHRSQVRDVRLVGVVHMRHLEGKRGRTSGPWLSTRSHRILKVMVSNCAMRLDGRQQNKNECRSFGSLKLRGNVRT